MNNRSENPVDAQTLDQLLSDLEHEVPVNFTERVMRSVDSSSVDLTVTKPAHAKTTPERRPLSWFQWCALIAGGLIGIGQIARIVFGLWFAAAAW